MRDDFHSLVRSAPLTIHHANRQPPGTVSIYLSHRPRPFPAPLQGAHLFSSRPSSSRNIFPTLSKTGKQVGCKSSLCHAASKLTAAPSGLRQRCRHWLLSSVNSAQRFMPDQQIPSAPSIFTISGHRGSLGDRRCFSLLFPLAFWRLLGKCHISG